jgi:hypothetical protein
MGLSKRVLLLALACTCLALVATTPACAIPISIRFDDNQEGPVTVTENGMPCAGCTSVREGATYTRNFPQGTFGGLGPNATPPATVSLLEPTTGVGDTDGRQSPSDRLFLTIARLPNLSETLTVKFQSDGAPIAGPVGINNRVFETGGFQDLTPIFALEPGTLPTDLKVEARSDFSPTPEPTTLFLWGTTMAGLGLVRWRRRRQS